MKGDDSGKGRIPEDALNDWDEIALRQAQEGYGPETWNESTNPWPRGAGGKVHTQGLCIAPVTQEIVLVRN